MKPTVTNHSFYSDLFEAEDGLAIRQLFSDYSRAAGFNLPEWPAGYDEAMTLFRPMEEPVKAGTVRLKYSAPDARNHNAVQMTLSDDKHEELLMMVQQRENGQWNLYLRIDKAYLKALPGAGVIVGEFIQRVMSS